MSRHVQLMIVGAAKAGTTALLRYLVQHPDLYTHPQREMAFFVSDVEYRRGYQKAFSKYFGDCPDHKSVLVAKHAIAMYSSEAVQRLYEHNPQMHLVVLLRNPVDRAYSSYLYARRMGRENIQTFEGALQREEEVFTAADRRLQAEWLGWRRDAYLHNGIYVRYLETLRRYFERSQLHVFLTDDMKSQSAAICHGLFAALHVAQDGFHLNVSRVHNRSAMAKSELLAQVCNGFFLSRHPVKRVLRGLIPHSISYKLRHTLLRFNEQEFTPPPMHPETRARLVEYFRSYNTALSEALGRDVSHWNH